MLRGDGDGRRNTEHGTGSREVKVCAVGVKSRRSTWWAEICETDLCLHRGSLAFWVLLFAFASHDGNLRLSWTF